MYHRVTYWSYPDPSTRPLAYASGDHLRVRTAGSPSAV